MTRPIILAALVGVLVSGPVWAKDEKGVFSAYGKGSAKCTEFLGEYATAELKRKPDGSISYRAGFGDNLGWIQGYASGVNETAVGAQNFYADMDTIDLVAWAASFCKDNPTDSLSSAMQALTLNRLKKWK